jgi:phage baseplate assembly protein gpV
MTIGSFNAYQEATAQDYTGSLFLGRVVNNADPLGLGRFQVRIPGLYEEGALPWVGSVRYSPFGVGKGFGMYGSPKVGSTAIIELQDGDANMPICHGFILTDPDKDPAYASPDTWGYVDPSGNRLLVDMAAHTWTWTHSSGTTYNINAAGDLTATVVGNQTINVQGNSVLNVQGNTEVHTSGTTTVTSGGAASLTAPSVLVDSPNSHFTGDVKIDGNLEVGGTTTSQGTIFGNSGLRIIGNAGGGTGIFVGDLIQTSGIMSSNGIVVHTHVHQDSMGGTTGQPHNP